VKHSLQYLAKREMKAYNMPEEEAKARSIRGSFVFPSQMPL
jgi:hypothetical protein